MHEDARIDFFAFEAVADEAAVADADRVGSGSVEGAPAVLAALVARRIAVDDYERGGEIQLPAFLSLMSSFIELTVIYFNEY